nr:nucleotidyltransferase family protein [uncultured Aminipila sp.]
MRDKINIILLAAGNSRRFGSNKLLTEFRGKTLYRYTFDMAKKLAEWLEKTNVHSNIVIVSQYEEILSEAEKLGYLAIENKEPELGISYSIKLSLRECSETADKTNKNFKEYHKVSYLFFVCDQPLLHSESVINLVSAYMNNDKAMGCLVYKNRLGNPCIFDSKCVPNLLELEGDAGGKKIILLNPDSTLTVESCDEKELFDIDNIADLNELANDLK